VALHIVAVVHALMLKGTGISPLSSMSVAVAALILGEAVLIADLLPMINRFPNKPLIYNVVWETLIYMLAATLIHYLEHLIDFWRQAGRLCGRQRKAAGKIHVLRRAEFHRNVLSKSCGRISGPSRSCCSY
jgi:hypothetical protein